MYVHVCGIIDVTHADIEGEVDQSLQVEIAEQMIGDFFRGKVEAHFVCMCV